jgi:hypothetical protein
MTIGPQLPIHPAVGYETLTRLQVAICQRESRTPSKKRAEGDITLWVESQGRMLLNNVSKVCGYLPGLSLIVGVARIILNNMHPSALSDTRPIELQHTYRGIAEICQLGIFLLILDLIATIRDNWVVNAYIQKYPNVLDYPEKVKKT